MLGRLRGRHHQACTLACPPRPRLLGLRPLPLGWHLLPCCLSGLCCLALGRRPGGGLGRAARLQRKLGVNLTRIVGLRDEGRSEVQFIVQGYAAGRLATQDIKLAFACSCLASRANAVNYGGRQTCRLATALLTSSNASSLLM